MSTDVLINTPAAQTSSSYFQEAAIAFTGLNFKSKVFSKSKQFSSPSSSINQRIESMESISKCNLGNTQNASTVLHSFALFAASEIRNWDVTHRQKDVSIKTLHLPSPTLHTFS